ncbi:MAG: hypothetical protein AB7F19_03210 [Candidatus Babeliales bacterium]
MKIKILVIFISMYTALQACNYTSLRTTHEYKRQKCLHSFVVFLQDEQGNKYIVKEYPHTRWRPRCTLTICEVLATEIAHAVGVMHDDICLIPAGVPFVGKNTGVPAALHTHAPGIPFKQWGGNPYKGLCLLQEKHRGLTRAGIYHMSRNKSLPPLMALDTFVGNNDRGRNNYFYDQETDLFTGIDLGCAFSRNLCAPSVNSMQSLLTDSSVTLSAEERHALFAYNETLKQLITLYPADRTCDLLDSYAYQAGLFDEKYFDRQAQHTWRSLLDCNKKTICASYTSAQELVSVLEHFLAVAF